MLAKLSNDTFTSSTIEESLRRFVVDGACNSAQNRALRRALLITSTPACWVLTKYGQEEATRLGYSKGWSLWIDDQIHDPDAPDRWTPVGYQGAASIDDAIALVREFGPPAHVDLDHDLGEDEAGHELTAKPFAKWLFDNYPNNVPTCVIHSRNGDGGKWLASYFDSWQRTLPR